MCAATKFGGEVADANDAHLVAILFAEQRHGVILVDGHVDGNIFDGLDFAVAQHFFIDDVFDVLQLFVCDGSEVGKIKTQMSRRDQRSGLLDVLA